jgi:predicted porin
LENFSMKKTLIALAAVAVSSAAMAQVTVSGAYGFGHESVTSQATNSAGAKTKVNGLRNMTGSVRFTAVEDLGNGMKASASIQFGVTGRAADAADKTPSTGSTAISGAGSRVAQEDASITLSGAFGAVTLGSVEAGNGIVGLGGAGAPVRGFNNAYNSSTGSLLAGAANVDLLQYTSPTFNGVTLRAQMIDSIGAPGAGGAQTAATTAKATVVGVRYAAGPLTVDVDSTSGDRNTQTISSTATFTDKRTRLSAQYNFGVARVGYGQEKRTVFTAASTSSEITDTIMGVAVPMGAFTVGATYGTSKDGANAKATGSEFGAKYDFSKRTSLTAQMGSFKKADTSKQSITRVRLDHTF